MHSGIRDNHKRGAIGDYLKEQIKLGADLSIVSAYFTIFAFEKLKDQLSNINGLRFLFGEPAFIKPSQLNPEFQPLTFCYCFREAVAKGL